MLLVLGTAVAQDEDQDKDASTEPKSFAEATDDLERRDGLIETWIDRKEGKLLLALPPPDPATGIAGRYLYQAYLRRGLGSNPLGLDRSVGGDTQLIAVRQAGGKVLFEAENWRYQAHRGGVDEVLAVGESFARSVIWATDIIAHADDGRVLIDIGPFLARDALGLAARFKLAEQGELTFDEDRSVVEVAETLVFPDNLELESTITFTGSEPGEEIRQTTPDPTAVSLVQHHSLVRLPPAGFEPRQWDPRTGAIEHVRYDYAAPLHAPLVTRLARRHRLELDAAGRVVEPIVYYLDRGTPEPVRQALLDGARWWTAAFEAAGFPGGYRVEMLPTGAHPLDVRYNIISWVHRATRGWSYGASVVDPRTGEIIKGYVILGSQRVRQDRMIFEGLAGTANTGTGAPDDPVQLALARIRQLSAHEVGHTLGLQHNFAASADGRESVMDYPAPWVRVTSDGGLDFSAAYGVGLGRWDRFAIEWLYRQYPDPGTEQRSLEQLIGEARAEGLQFITDEHGRGVGTAHPAAAVWDNGDDPVAALTEAMAVRRIALAGFGPDRVGAGLELGQLRRVLVPIYLYHRYQVDAAAKLVGGAAYEYRVRGDAGNVRWVDGDRQRAALQALLATIDPAALDLPDALLAELAPFSRGFFDDPVTDRELFASHTGPIFDPLAAAAAAAGITLQALLHPQRAARLVEQHRLDARLPGLDDVMDEIRRALFDRPRGENDRFSELRRVVQRTHVETLITLAQEPQASGAVVARTEAHLRQLGEALAASRGDGTQAEHDRWLAARIERHLDRPAAPAAPLQPAPQPPPGSPIGAAEGCWHCEP